METGVDRGKNNHFTLHYMKTRTTVVMIATLSVSFHLGAAIAETNDETRAQIKHAMELLGSTNKIERSKAVSTLGRFGSESVPDLLHAARTETGLKRSEAIFVLSQIADPMTCSELETLLKQNKPALPVMDQVVIVGALGRMEGQTCLPLFSSMFLQAKAPELKFALAWQLSKIGDEAGTAYLTGHWLKLLEEGTEYHRTAAASALKKMYGQDFGTDAKRWREWIKNNSDKTGQY